MPLPFPVSFIDGENRIRNDVAVAQGKKPSGYRPTTEYHPTMRLVRCFSCKTIGVAEFVNGFNLRDGDSLMAGRSIRGVCLRCQKETDLNPLPTDIATQKELQLYYRVQKSIDAYRRRGWGLGGVLYPIERIEAIERAAQNAGIQIA